MQLLCKPCFLVTILPIRPAFSIPGDATSAG
jgi:hypothetical protein